MSLKTSLHGAMQRSSDFLGDDEGFDSLSDGGRSRKQHTSDYSMRYGYGDSFGFDVYVPLRTQSAVDQSIAYNATEIRRGCFANMEVVIEKEVVWKDKQLNTIEAEAEVEVEVQMGETKHYNSEEDESSGSWSNKNGNKTRYERKYDENIDDIHSLRSSDIINDKMKYKEKNNNIEKQKGVKDDEVEEDEDEENNHHGDTTTDMHSGTDISTDSDEDEDEDEDERASDLYRLKIAGLLSSTSCSSSSLLSSVPRVVQILIVDDSVVQRKMSRLLLAGKVGNDVWMVNAVDSGERAMEYLKGAAKNVSAPEIIIIDQNMSSAGGQLLGHEVVSLIRRNHVFADSILIGCTAYAAEARKHFIEAGCDAVWTKPMPSKEAINTEINEIRKKKEENRKLKNNYNFNSCGYATVRHSKSFINFSNEKSNRNRNPLGPGPRCHPLIAVEKQTSQLLNSESLIRSLLNIDNDNIRNNNHINHKYNNYENYETNNISNNSNNNRFDDDDNNYIHNDNDKDNLNNYDNCNNDINHIKSNSLGNDNDNNSKNNDKYDNDNNNNSNNNDKYDKNKNDNKNNKNNNDNNDNNNNDNNHNKNNINYKNNYDNRKISEEVEEKFIFDYLSS